MKAVVIGKLKAMMALISLYLQKTKEVLLLNFKTARRWKEKRDKFHYKEFKEKYTLNK